MVPWASVASKIGDKNDRINTTTEKTIWPLYDIAITNSVWCNAYRGGGRLRNDRWIELQ